MLNPQQHENLRHIRELKRIRTKHYTEMGEIDPEAIASDLLTLNVADGKAKPDLY